LTALTIFIDRNLARTIRLPELAGLVDLSVFHFSREFKAAANKSPMRYVLERRVEAAKIGMAGQKPLAEVALDAGFSSQSHFTTAFRLTTGMTPCQWRRAQATD
jgi:AraC family transcriptional regulator